MPRLRFDYLHIFLQLPSVWDLFHFKVFIAMNEHNAFDSMSANQNYNGINLDFQS